jgi:hypothetical protein
VRRGRNRLVRIDGDVAAAMEMAMHPRVDGLLVGRLLRHLDELRVTVPLMTLMVRCRATASARTKASARAAVAHHPVIIPKELWLRAAGISALMTD